MKNKLQWVGAALLLLRVVLVVMIYELASIALESPALPDVCKIACASADVLRSEKFISHCAYTVKIVLEGLAVAFIVGEIIAVTSYKIPAVRHIVMPVVNSTKNIPSISLFPLFIVLLGIGDTSRVAIIVWNSTFPIVASTIAAFEAIDKEVIEAAQNAGAGSLQQYIYIEMPLSLIGVLNGVKIAAGNGFIAIVVAEMLGATKGLGYMVLWSANTFKYSEMYVYIIVIALIGLAINSIIEKTIAKAERKLYYENHKHY